MSNLLENLLIFGRVLRREGIDVHPGRMVDVVEALGQVNLGARDEVYHASRALLVHRPEQLGTFDRVFADFWRVHRDADVHSDTKSGEPRTSSDAIEIILELGDPTTAGGDADGDAPAPETGVKLWSDRGGLADKDFAAF